MTPPVNEKRPVRWTGRSCCEVPSGSAAGPEGAVRADLVEGGADAAPQEQQGDDRYDRDEGKDQRVFRQPLPPLIHVPGKPEAVEQLLEHAGFVPPPALAGPERQGPPVASAAGGPVMIRKGGR